LSSPSRPHKKICKELGTKFFWYNENCPVLRKNTILKRLGSDICPHKDSREAHGHGLNSARKNPAPKARGVSHYKALAPAHNSFHGYSRHEAKNSDV